MRAYVGPMTPRQQGWMLVRLTASMAFAGALAVAVAAQVGANKRAGWDLDSRGAPDGDPDGESIAQVFEFLAGAGVFAGALAVVALLEVGLWLLRREALSACDRMAAQRHEPVGCDLAFPGAP
jgi:cytosine/adenosine deaminase-related metal-dependent hydrolase